MKGILSFCILVYSLAVAHAQMDPIIQMLSGYQYQQAGAEVLPVDYYSIKYRDYLGLNNAEMKWFRETQPKIVICEDPRLELQKRRDRYMEVMDKLDRNQQSKLNSIQYLEKETSHLLITPSVQRFLNLSEDQRRQIQSIHGAIRERNNEIDLPQDAYQERRALYSFHRYEAGQEMLVLLTEEQKERIHRKEMKVPLESLEQLRWRKRVILIDGESLDWEATRELLNQHEDAIQERDIGWIFLTEETVRKNFKQALGTSFPKATWRKYFRGRDDPKVILFGKDGGVKGEYETLDLEAIFALIDTMPMRQAEMREQAEAM